jgi:hypothetical protein
VASGIGGLIVVEQGASFLILWNVLARAVIVALLLGGWFAAGKKGWRGVIGGRPGGAIPDV